MHSDRSDGRHPPDEVLRRAVRGGLDLIALTDHDLPTTLPLGHRVIDGKPIHVLAGAEISGEHEGHEYHLLVYFGGPVPEAFQAFCRVRSQARAERYDAAVRSLGLQGLSLADASAHEGERALTRHHLARALVEAGHALDLRDAFRRYTGNQGHVPPFDLSFVDAIRTARAMGGFTSWAHPPMTALKDHGATFVQAGLQAIEGIRPRLSGEERRRLRREAERLGVVITGGSDWHGFVDGEPGLFSVEAPSVAPFLRAMALLPPADA
jgi:predicted metal-dependent phosphoesterase TrpH